MPGFPLEGPRRHKRTCTYWAPSLALVPLDSEGQTLDVVPAKEAEHVFHAVMRIQLGNGTCADFWWFSWLPGPGVRSLPSLRHSLAMSRSPTSLLLLVCTTTTGLGTSGEPNISVAASLWDVVSQVSLEPNAEDSIHWPAPPAPILSFLGLSAFLHGQNKTGFRF